MSEAHTKLPLGKWSKTTCIDLNLKLPLKCHNCIAAEEQRSLCLRKSTKKRKRKNVKNVCTQPWSLSFKDSKELTKRNTYHKVWAYLIANGHIKGEVTRDCDKQEELSTFVSFRSNGAKEKKERTNQHLLH